MDTVFNYRNKVTYKVTGKWYIHGFYQDMYVEVYTGWFNLGRKWLDVANLAEIQDCNQ